MRQLGSAMCAYSYCQQEACYYEIMHSPVEGGVSGRTIKSLKGFWRAAPKYTHQFSLDKNKDRKALTLP